MRFETEFVVNRPRAEVALDLDDDGTFASLFPGTEVRTLGSRVRETRTLFQALGVSRDIRFVFETLPDGNVHFEKVCDGKVWRSLEGEIRLESQGSARTRIRLQMEGHTRWLVPEITIQLPLRQQLDRMTASLRAHLAQA